MTVPRPEAIVEEAPPVARSFDEFCVRVHPRLVGALGLRTGDAQLAEDLAQEALARAYRSWDVVQQAESLDDVVRPQIHRRAQPL